MTDVEHISRKGTGVPISWFPVPDESELPEGLRRRLSTEWRRCFAAWGYPD